MSTRQALGRASFWMALGTLVSRLSGFVRLFLLMWVLGIGLNGDLFTVANSIPNAMYFLVAGGVFNVVLVPQIVRAMREDDGGDGYVNRVVTLAFVVLGVGSIVLTLAAPLLVPVVFDSKILEDGMEVQRHSATMLMYLVIPQVFFYGAFVLRGQILNARQVFGPMMWAPIVNNIVSVAVLLSYLVVFGRSRTGNDGFSTGEVLLLGIGSTLGIAAQAAALTPFLRKSGFRFTPIFNFRGFGLGHTMRLGAWTLGFIVISQVAMIAITRIASGATLTGAADGHKALGVTIYNLGYLVSQVPHGIITVSLTTALLPTMSVLAARGESRLLLDEIRGTLRTIAFLITPIAMAVFVLGNPAAGIISWMLPGAIDGPEAVTAVGHCLSAFGLGLFSFSFSYFILRGFYADEDTKTPFFVQLVVVSVNVGSALILTHNAPPLEIPARLAIGFGTAYLVGALISSTILSRRFGRVFDFETTRFFVRLGIATGLAGALSAVTVRLVPGPAGTDFALGLMVGGLVFVGAATAMRISEIDQVRALVQRRRS
jgi:putative peptidoglycan lipid II flippase